MHSRKYGNIPQHLLNGIIILICRPSYGDLQGVALPIQLSIPERRHVESLLRTNTLGPRLEDHIKIIIMIHDGNKYNEIVNELEVSRKTIWKVVRRYQLFGIDGILIDAPRTRSGQLSPEPGLKTL